MTRNHEPHGATSSDVSLIAAPGISIEGNNGDAGMVAAHNRVLIAVSTLIVVWLLALRALTDLSAWAMLAGVVFLTIVGVSVLKASRI
jgi:hypothetical protein